MSGVLMVFHPFDFRAIKHIVYNTLSGIGSLPAAKHFGQIIQQL